MSKQMEDITTRVPPVRVAVIGFGTVGSTIARLCVQRGFEVKVYDTAAIPAIPPPTSEGIGLARTFAEAVDVAHTTAVIICVPTPPAPSGGHDTSALQSTLASLGQVRCLCPVLTMSTVCPGTMARFAALHDLHGVGPEDGAPRPLLAVAVPELPYQEDVAAPPLIFLVP